ncbi:hypothetical protein FQA39_LY09880 [Lamprigera yunnana]|nr:hypothetical protein FQA39_LY09880 [Lamprigera yunnana]
MKITLNMDTSETLLSNCISTPNIEMIQIKCDVKKLSFAAFSNQINLKTLKLKSNLIPTIPHNFFGRLNSLETFDISYNKMKNLNLGTFASLQKLKILNLSFNELRKIEVGVFDDLHQLEFLILSNNKMTNLPVGVLDELVNMKSLDLSNNVMTKIEPSLFISVQNLEKLYLSGNLLKREDSLSGVQSLTQLKTLDLSNSNIQSGHLKLLRQSVKLEELDLSYNHLFQIPSDTFISVPELTKISLRNCELKNLEEKIFLHNFKLKNLDVSNNALRSLPNSLLPNSTNELEYLNVSHNYISNLSTNTFNHVDVFEIDISFNELTEIGEDILNMEKVNKIHMQNNKISHIHDLAFASCSFPIKYLNIANNRMVFFGEYFMDWLANLEKIEIHGNPWECKCLDELQTTLNNRFIEYDQSRYSHGTIPYCGTVEFIPDWKQKYDKYKQCWLGCVQTKESKASLQRMRLVKKHRVDSDMHRKGRKPLKVGSESELYIIQVEQ